MAENFPYSYQNIADGFGITQSTLRSHKQNHIKDLVKNIDFISVQTKTGYKIYFSQQGVIKLADWINTKEAKKFIGTLEVKKEIQEKKEIVPAQTQPTNQIDFLQGLLDLLKNQETRIATIEQRIEKVESKPSTFYLDVNNLQKYKEYRKEKLMEDYRRPISSLLHSKFDSYSPEARWGIARKLYKLDTGWDFPYVDKANTDQLEHFLGWIKEK